MWFPVSIHHRTLPRNVTHALYVRYEAIQQDEDVDDGPRSLFDEIDYADSTMWDDLIVEDNGKSFVGHGRSLVPEAGLRGLHDRALPGRHVPPHLDVH
jgi:hypothetical protein